MKVPLEHEPFAPVHLTRAQEQQLEWLSEALLEETLAEFHDFVHVHHRVVDKKQWKQTMARENVTMYKRVGKGDPGGVTPDVTLHQTNPAPSSITWRIPRVIGVGTIPGTAEEAIYGMLAINKRETNIRTSYVKDEAGDARVLANVISPTDEEPLRSLLVRWSLVYQFIHKYVVTPRDVVNMESVGMRVLPNGQRIGYIVLQSVDVPGCEELTDLGVIRCKFSSCYILRDMGNGSVELYMRGFVEMGGSMSESVAVLSACVALISVWRIMICGQNKKLVWMIQNGVHHRSASSSILDVDDVKNCALCRRSISGFRSSVKCDICSEHVCSKCANKRKLTHARSSGELVRVAARVCKTCITTAAKTPASHVALSQYVPTSSRSSRYNSAYTSSSSSSSSSGSSHSNRPTRSPDVGGWRRNQDFPKTHATEVHHQSTSTATTAVEDGGYDSDACSLQEEPFSVGSPAYSRSSLPGFTPVVEEHDDTLSQSQMQLWLRMNKLRVAAEETYLLTQQNASVMMDMQAGVQPRGRAASTQQRTHGQQY